MVSLSERAGKKVKELMEKEASAKALRVIAAPGGCAGVKYHLVFDDAVSEHDVQQNQHGIQVVYEKGIEAFVKGLEIDYTESLEQTGFVMKNAEAKHGCGCGKSYGF